MENFPSMSVAVPTEEPLSITVTPARGSPLASVTSPDTVALDCAANTEAVPKKIMAIRALIVRHNDLHWVIIKLD